jgi:hypothetical protein
MPHYNALLTATAQGIVEAKTTTLTHSLKTGRLLKNPKVIVDPDFKALKRALGNPELLAKRMPWFPPPTLKCVPEEERVGYATLDAWGTVCLEPILRAK